jgi:hypothetical protein
MDSTNEAAVGGSEPTAIAVAPAPHGEMSLDAREAARNLAKWRHSREKQGPQQASQQREERERDEMPSHVADVLEHTDAGEDEATVEGTAAAEQADECVPIEPPSSWSEEDKAVFASLPRSAQERLAERERSREGELAEQRKLLEADRALLDEARQKYEATLPQVLAALQQQGAGEFADIKTPADIERLAREDQPRFAKWDLQQKQIAEVTRQILGAQARQASEQQRRFADFAKRQDDLFKDKVPQMADPAEVAKLQSAAMAVLKDHGFEEAELAAS